MLSQSLWEDLQAIRQESPLIHNVTNYVVMQHSANCLLAVGASPVMTEAIQEVCEMTHLAGALVLNMGTLDSSWEARAQSALAASNDRDVPLVFDPVGAGATAYRTSSAKQLIETGAMTVIRGNAAEIASIGGQRGQLKGVDSLMESSRALPYCHQVAVPNECVVVASGAVDIVVDNTHQVCIRNGSPMMAQVTGMGCAASALIGAFLAVNDDPFLAAVHGMSLMGIAGEIAASKAEGPGTFGPAFIDTLHGLKGDTIQSLLRVEAL